MEMSGKEGRDEERSFVVFLEDELLEEDDDMVFYIVSLCLLQAGVEKGKKLFDERYNKRAERLEVNFFFWCLKCVCMLFLYIYICPTGEKETDKSGWIDII